MTRCKTVMGKPAGMWQGAKMLSAQSMVRFTPRGRGKWYSSVFADSRSFLNASYRSLLRTYILSPPGTQPSVTLLTLLESPRVRYVNLSYLDDDSGRSLLHETARRKDLRLIELAVRAGADVFVRDRKGKMAYDGVGKDDRVRVFLRQCELSILLIISGV
jgi:ankyrin repeat protein